MRAHHRFLILLVLGLAGSALPAPAAGPSLLRDIFATGVDQNHAAEVAGDFMPLGRWTLVPMEEPSSGQELWITDGTDAGTRLLLDLCPGPCSTLISSLGVIDGVGLFYASETSGPQPWPWRLWRSDGTLLGTFPLAGGQRAGSCYTSGSLIAVIAGPRLFFTAQSDSFDCGLWVTDGTAAGTVLLREFPHPDFRKEIGNLTAAGDRVFFQLSDEHGIELWRSDGTVQGTVVVRSWVNDSRLPESFVAVGNRLFFAKEEEGDELWTSDGTPAGTRSLTRFAPAEPFVYKDDSAINKVFVFQALDGFLYFLANDGISGRELWRSDGTSAGTRPSTAFTVASPFTFLNRWRIEKLGGRLLFGANDGGSGFRLWTTDGRPESTTRVDGCPGGCPLLAPDAELVRLGSRIYFTSNEGGTCSYPDEVGNDLWTSDGTGAGTRRIAEFCPCCRVGRLLPVRGKLFFAAAQDRFFNADIWGSDGTAQGTRLLVSTNGARLESALPVWPVDTGRQVLLGVVDWTTVLNQLWASEGTPETTHQVVSLPRNGRDSGISKMVPTVSGARFWASDGTSYRLWSSEGTAATTRPLDIPFLNLPTQNLESFGNLTLGWGDDGLWGTDGTPAGTLRLTPEGAGRVTDIEVLPDRAVFMLGDSFVGEKSLWSTDGTVGGTQKILDSGFYEPLAPLGSEVLFSSGDALWVSDGSSAGTRPLASGNFWLGGQSARLGSIVYFTVDTQPYLRTLWRTDGTTAGTHPVIEGQELDLWDLVAYRGALYFMAAVEAAHNVAGLWMSDGTEAGTVLLRAFARNPREPAQFTPLGDALLFRAIDSSTSELWRTDGTPAGTVRIHGISPGWAGSEPGELAVLAGKAYLAAQEKKHGMELWETDGTSAGTRLVQDIAAGAFSSSPEHLTAAGGRLYFTADDGFHGREPWVYTPGGATCIPSDTVLCLGGGRFKVEADWRTESSSGRGGAVSLTPDTGYFWFFDSSNVEVILKVLDGQGLNGHHWVFYGALSNVEYALTVTDTQTGAARRYTNRPGRLGSVADTEAFGPRGASAPGVITAGPAPSLQQTLGEAIVTSRTTDATGSCTPSATRLCLQDGRFAVEARWKAQGQNGTGKAVALTGGDTGYFWFFDANNVEVVLKVLDGTSLNGKFWVFYGALSDVEYTLTVTDTVTGAVKTYTNPSGRLASVADTEGF